MAPVGPNIFLGNTWSVHLNHLPFDSICHTNHNCPWMNRSHCPSTNICQTFPFLCSFSLRPFWRETALLQRVPSRIVARSTRNALRSSKVCSSLCKPCLLTRGRSSSKKIFVSASLFTTSGASLSLNESTSRCAPILRTPCCLVRGHRGFTCRTRSPRQIEKNLAGGPRQTHGHL